MLFFKNDHKLYAIVSDKDNPSYEFYFKSFTSSYSNFIRLDNPLQLSNDFDAIVFIRYIDSKWKPYVNKFNLLVYYFFDDDLLNFRIAQNVPISYLKKIVSKVWIHIPWLKRKKARLIVSSEYLYNRYKENSPYLLKPTPIEPLSPQEKKIVFYHGTLTHIREIYWLTPIVHTILKSYPNVYFEFIGGKNIRKLFWNIERILVISPYHFS